MALKTYKFEYNIGDHVHVSNPLDTWGLKGTVTQQIKPLMFPEGKFTTDNLILMPRTRKEYRTTRQISYLVRINDTELDFWVTEMCVKKD